jgi:hypothetical protein
VGQLPPKQNLQFQKNTLQANQQEHINQNLSVINNTSGVYTNAGKILTHLSLKDFKQSKSPNTLSRVGLISVNSHNPLTNPIPNIQQNPYIRREMGQARFY